MVLLRLRPTVSINSRTSVFLKLALKFAANSEPEYNDNAVSATHAHGNFFMSVHLLIVKNIDPNIFKVSVTPDNDIRFFHF